MTILLLKYIELMWRSFVLFFKVKIFCTEYINLFIEHVKNYSLGSLYPYDTSWHKKNKRDCIQTRQPP
jgi:hypothetical protein